MIDHVKEIQGEAVSDSLHQAIKEGKYSAVAKALEAGADPNAPCSVDGDVPLIRAIRYKYSGIVDLLICKGAKVKGVHDSKGASPLAIACASNELRTVELILAAVADVNEMMTSEEITALHVAVKESSIEIVELLLKHGADTEAFDWDGEKVIEYAEGRQDVIELLKSVRQKDNANDTKINKK